jgi:hypothetical protein
MLVHDWRFLLLIPSAQPYGDANSQWPSIMCLAGQNKNPGAGPGMFIPGIKHPRTTIQAEGRTGVNGKPPPAGLTGACTLAVKPTGQMVSGIQLGCFLFLAVEPRLWFGKAQIHTRQYPNQT